MAKIIFFFNKLLLSEHCYEYGEHAFNIHVEHGYGQHESQTYKHFYPTVVRLTLIKYSLALQVYLILIYLQFIFNLITIKCYILVQL